MTEISAKNATKGRKFRKRVRKPVHILNSLREGHILALSQNICKKIIRNKVLLQTFQHILDFILGEKKMRINLKKRFTALILAGMMVTSNVLPAYSATDGIAVEQADASYEAAATAADTAVDAENSEAGGGII